MLGGVDLIRKKERKPAFCATNALLTTSEGKKMGKTERGAVWLDKEKFSVYDFYQYWRNVDDADVERCLAMLTFLPMEEVRGLCGESGAALNEAKRVLAVYPYRAGSRNRGGGKGPAGSRGAVCGQRGFIQHAHGAPERGRYQPNRAEGRRPSGEGRPVQEQVDARRMIESGAVFAGDAKVDDVSAAIDPAKLEEGVILKKGKKGFVRILKA